MSCDHIARLTISYRKYISVVLLISSCNLSYLLCMALLLSHSSVTFLSLPSIVLYSSILTWPLVNSNHPDPRG
ncbi:hypothetical protein VN97_g8250 [Penicillium thymicola]|uniref:Uncharacterized protein n=1 Tax=Penicillium thymicola TaxID=293382 RepID=A0AAI9X635_PENTH|nr:hypothetical protein VN97_g8250 [Penicillium thymicola]